LSAIEPLAWDSAFFGFAIGRVRPEVEAGELGAALREADEEGLRCLYLLAAADDHLLLQSAQRHGFLVRDVRVELERPVAGHASAMDGLREAQPGDRPRLAAIARESIRGTRFLADDGFPRERAHELYVEWLERGLEPGASHGALTDEELVGFVTCGLDRHAGVGSIELIAVAPGARGKGVGGRLMAGAGALFAGASLETATVVTQGHNIAAQRLYQACGYRISSVKLWLHRWRPPGG